MPVLAKIRALSNETRFEIVKLIRDREMDAGTVARQFKMTRPAVSQRLSVLREAGLVNERRVGSKRLTIRQNLEHGAFMAVVKRTHVINKPVDVVFQTVVDVANFPKWNPTERPQADDRRDR